MASARSTPSVAIALATHRTTGVPRRRRHGWSPLTHDARRSDPRHSTRGRPPAPRPQAFRETMEPERMYVETIFSEVVDGVTYLSWHSVRGEGAADVQESTHWLDEQHVAFWQVCIDPDFPPQDLTPKVHMTPARVEAAMRPLD
ncbi:DUF6176 family protein [Micrococcus luteus]|uniref:DUF6176 family protein n=1 Tax=Micrococcus luteus TaxID=1270 RepID=UPI00249F66B4|nr:DUF6176 family protein [Micrococcus luteus]